MSGPVDERGLWLAGSLLLALLAANVAWLFGGRAGRRWQGAGWPALWRGPWPPAAGWLLVALYLLLPPFAAWRSGAISPYLLGLAETDWLAALGVPGLVAAGVVLLGLAGWLVFRRSLRIALAAEAAAGRGALAGGQVAAEPAMRRWLAPLDAALYQWHAAFYRAIIIGWLAVAASAPAGLVRLVPGLAPAVSGLWQAWHDQPVYWGSWLGLLVLALEWVLNPFARQALRTPGRMEGALRSVGMVIATAALFSFTRSFWLCLFCATAVELLIAGWFPAGE